MLITEIFKSLQGEGPFIGIPMFFIRTNRCNLRCRWCDSAYTFYGGHEVPLDDLIEKVKLSGLDWVCFTGGEPLLQREALDFVREVCDSGKSVLIETSGSLPVKPYTAIKNAFIDMDIKTPSSGEDASLYQDNLYALRRQDYVKFVIADEVDYEFAKSWIPKLPGPMQIVFQPVWGKDLKWLAEKVLADNLPVRVLTQLHKLIWGEIPGV
ncbi:MAG: 7-carboxy-7-deazaguanine synthase QueE [Thermoplasmata archaeon]